MVSNPNSRSLRQPAIYSRSDDGHRAEYLSFVQSQFGGARAGLLQLVFTRRPALFLMVEEAFGAYVLLSICRSLFGAHTVGLLFRPLPALKGNSLRLRVKRVLLRALTRFASVQTLAIFPSDLEPGVETIVHDWIYDFQLWDLSAARRSWVSGLRDKGIAGAPEVAELLWQVREAAGSRKVICTLGRQDLSKGLGHFAELAQDEQVRRDWLFVSAGRIDPSCAALSGAMRDGGALVLDRFISDEELLALYAACDAVWCAYAPTYDQASGILGRAVQLGVCPVVRADSIMHRLCLAEDIACMTPGDLSGAAACGDPGKEDPSCDERIERFRQASRSTLSRALGLNTSLID